jgi:hypothetical protein
MLCKIIFGVRFRVGLLCKHQQPQLPLPFAGFCNALPVVAISYVSSVVYLSQIASSVVQAVAIYMVAFFSFSQLPAQNAF